MSYDPDWDKIKQSPPPSGDLTGTYPNLELSSTGVTPGTYGGGSDIPVLTIDGKGRVTTASTVSLSGSLPDLVPSPAGTYGGATSVVQMTIDAKGRVTSASTLPGLTDTVAPGTYGSATQALSLTLNSQGRVTGLTQHPVAPRAWAAVGTPNTNWYLDSSSRITLPTSSPIVTPPAFEGQFLYVHTHEVGYNEQFLLYLGLGGIWRCLSWNEP